MRGRTDDGDAGDDPALQLRRVADPHQLSQIRTAVVEWAERVGVGPEALIDLQLAVGEAAANAVEHAYRDLPRGDVEIELALRRGGTGVPSPVVAVRVTDHGSWRPAPVTKGYRGRGLAMIRELAQHVELSGTGAGTVACFEIPLTQ